MTPCPLCGSATAPKFDRGSDWCGPCVKGELAEQAALDVPTQERQVIDVTA